MFDIDIKVETLTKCLSSLKKSRYNKISTKTLIEKAKLAETLKNEIEKYLLVNEHKLPDTTLIFLSKVARNTNLEIQTLIKLKLKENSDEKVTMANPEPVPEFDFKRATALVQTYDGSPSGLNTFLDSVSLLEELTPPGNLATTIKFLKTRLSGKARSALPLSLC